MLPEQIAEVREWLEKAAEDIGVAEHVFKAQLPYAGSVLFHCQQAAEKALKAYLTWHNRTFRKTHELEELVAECTAVDSLFATLVNAAATLTPYAAGFRYPRKTLPPTAEDAEEALRLAKEVVAFILGRLPPEVRP